MNTTSHASLNLIGSSPAMRALDFEVGLAARSHAKVLITGETGVGKDVVARMIHHRSPRSNGPMAANNCRGLPGSPPESPPAHPARCTAGNLASGRR